MLFFFLVDAKVSQFVIMRHAIGQDGNDSGNEWMTGIEIDLMSGIGICCV